MPELRPFRGLRYTPAAGEPSELMAPPYDVIAPGQHAVLCQRSRYNIAHLILGDRWSADQVMSPDWYDDAAARFRAWQADGVLASEDTPAFYVYTQAFEHEGRQLRRALLLGALKLQPYDTGSIRPHEQTMPGPKADRLRLMQTCHANLSPILAFFPDPGARVHQQLESLNDAAPDLAFADEAGIEHELRCVFDGDAQRRLEHDLDPLSLYIADGHHRYETALAFQHLQASSRGHGGAAMPSDYLLAACMSAADPGMVIRPTHRVVDWTGGPDAEELLATAGQWYDITSLEAASAGDAVAAVCGSTSDVAFALYGGPSAGYALLVRRDAAAMSGSPHPPASSLHSLPAVVFAHGFVAPLLGRHEPRTAYTADADEAVRRVDDGVARLAGLLPPVRPPQLMATVDAGERMPPKSTYFWPKPLTGIVLRSLDRF